LKKEADKTKPLEERTYLSRKEDTFTNGKIVELRKLGYTIAKIGSILLVSESQVKLILKRHRATQAA